MARLLSPWLATATAISIASLVSAQQAGPFEGETTVSATGIEEDAADLPLGVTVIDREELDTGLIDSVAAAVARAAGTVVLTAGAEGSQTSLFTRGTESDHTLVLFDGVRLNSPFFGGYDLSQLSTAGLERIEVVRGPSSSLWGSDAIGGVVDLIPARATDETRARALFEGGQKGWRRGEADLAWGNGTTDLLISIFDREGEGPLDNSDFHTQQGIFDLGVTVGRARVAVLAQFAENEVEIPRSLGVPSPRREQSTDQTLLALPIRFDGEDFDLRASVSRVDRRIVFSDPDDSFGFTRSDTDAVTIEALLDAHHDLGAVTLSWGGAWRRDSVDDTSNFGVNLANIDADTLGIFASAGLDLDRLRGTVGMRWERTDEWGSELSPRFALSWKVHDQAWVDGSWGRSFRQPSLGELHFPGSGNPDLEPETGSSAEIALRLRKDRSRIRLAIFDTVLDDLIDFDFTTFAFTNVARADITGVELEWTLVASDSIMEHLALTWLDTDLIRRPEWSASYTISGSYMERWRGDVTISYIGSRKDVDPATFEIVDSPSYFTTDLAIQWRYNAMIELSMRLLNAADESYEPIKGFPAPDRRALFGVRIGR